MRPVELYPPVYNLARYLAVEQGIQVTIVTTAAKNMDYNLEKYGIRVVSIGRTHFKNASEGWRRYLLFYITAFRILLADRRSTVMYYESVSAIPVYLIYKLGLGSKRKLLIHFHEYFSPNEIRKQQRLERLGYKFEPYLFKKAVWISQTNNDRLNFFKKDFPGLDESKLRAFPNYPPGDWLQYAKKNKSGTNRPAKIVYVGAMSIRGFYTKEVFEWVNANKGEILLDIYSINIHRDALDLLEKMQCPYIQVKGGVKYDDIPKVICEYDAGLVIYDSTYTNFVYNVPNKVFEYLACGLDVWCSDDLLTTAQIAREKVYPKIVMVDFKNLEVFDWKDKIAKEGMENIGSSYILENAYGELADCV